MKLEKAFLIVAIAAIFLALPIGYALRYRQLLHVEQSHAGTLQLQLHSSQQQLQQRDTQLKATQQDSTKQQQQIKTLQQQLTVKQAAQRAEAARVAAAKLAMPVPSYVGMASDCGAYRGLVAQYSWDVHVALAIAHAESSCNPLAVSPLNYDGLRDFGLFQIHGEPIYDAAANTARAYQKYQTQGWNAWSVYKSGAYLKYL